MASGGRIRRRTGGAAMVLLSAVLPPSVPAAVESLTPTSLPMVLDDARIASVSVYRVAFAQGSAELAGEGAAGLDRLATEVADDCLLAARLIGHSVPEVEGAAVAAHRLARGRADAVQHVLAAHGVPQASMTSSWDWQFRVPEARATLWLFRLHRGEDCAGAPRRPPTADLLARPAPAPYRPAAPALEPARQVAAIARAEAAPAVPAVRPSAPADIAPAAAAGGTARACSAGPGCAVDPAGRGHRPDQLRCRDQLLPQGRHRAAAPARGRARPDAALADSR